MQYHIRGWRWGSIANRDINIRGQKQRDEQRRSLSWIEARSHRDAMKKRSYWINKWRKNCSNSSFDATKYLGGSVVTLVDNRAVEYGFYFIPFSIHASGISIWEVFFVLHTFFGKAQFQKDLFGVLQTTLKSINTLLFKKWPIWTSARLPSEIWLCLDIPLIFLRISGAYSLDLFGR